MYPRSKFGTHYNGNVLVSIVHRLCWQNYSCSDVVRLTFGGGGRTGDTWTIVEEQEARYFKGMLHEHTHLERVKRIKIPQKETEGLSTAYQVRKPLFYIGVVDLLSRSHFKT
ncbi:hypothetical protein BKA82DRAFT_184861 [Pisolithus tinctorius]|uniref:Uncharacterized protein n=1 Tax=Pisolithus tinctorius Marx 270 TaxID=870435 RepID=A0A0C3KZ02_PISTI|nr:hypothetical protein BKA82DRAFT_184861 [Pisolithus tinctorius]KIO14727.1 hypothetical protein M404DRAFT_184861 [Pisolithus tinctorius Marx 270]